MKVKYCMHKVNLEKTSKEDKQEEKNYEVSSRICYVIPWFLVLQNLFSHWKYAIFCPDILHCSICLQCVSVRLVHNTPQVCAIRY